MAEGGRREGGGRAEGWRRGGERRDVSARSFEVSRASLGDVSSGGELVQMVVWVPRACGDVPAPIGGH